MKLAPMAAAVLASVLLAAGCGGGDGSRSSEKASAAAAPHSGGGVAAAEERTYRANLRDVFRRAGPIGEGLGQDIDSPAELDEQLEAYHKMFVVLAAGMDDLRPPPHLADEHRRLRAAIRRVIRHGQKVTRAMRPDISRAELGRVVMPRLERMQGAVAELVTTANEVREPLGLGRYLSD